MASTEALIAQVADMIADFDPAAAQVFRAQPFRRAAIAAAFRRGFRTHTAHTLHVCDLIDRAAALDVAARQLAA